MPSQQKFPELENLVKIATVLDGLKIPYYVTGGFAVSIYGRPRFTADIDIVIKMASGVKKDFAKNHPEVLKRFLKAMKKAETFIGSNREVTTAIVSERLTIDRELVVSMWPDYSYQLLLDQSILVALENEARWAIKNKLTDKTQIPNYLNFIYPAALEAIKPEAVTIIR